MQRRWDIFCTVIDNFGDAGVCWRLARQLAAEYEVQVQLWIDDLSALQRLWPEIAINQESQIVAEVVIRAWRTSFPESNVADVVIEAFACTLPATYLAAMARREQAPVWINLEYLSAEAWTADCHGLASPQPDSALRKYFFFPGFTANSGGLLCERDLFARRVAFQADAQARRSFLDSLGVQIGNEISLISLFAYTSAPIGELLAAIATGSTPTLCLIPQGSLLTAVAEFFGDDELPIGAQRTRGALTVAVLPFLRQDHYDLLLWSCDLNLVRGEDSFVRAQWAARPVLWQIYPQQEGAHWVKLDAFVDMYKDELPAPTAAAFVAASHAWNGRGDIGAAWRDLQAVLPPLKQRAESWAERLHRNTNLAAALVQFCANNV